MNGIASPHKPRPFVRFLVLLVLTFGSWAILLAVLFGLACGFLALFGVLS